MATSTITDVSDLHAGDIAAVKGDGSVWRVQVQIAEPTPFGSPWGAWAEEDFTNLDEAVAWAHRNLSTSLIKTGKLD